MKCTIEIDNIIGSNIKDIRNKCELSQSELSKLIGISFQQLQKYEKGINRVSASMLFMISEKLSIPISDFYSTENIISYELNA